MDIIVKGRRTSVSDKFRQHVENKLNKLSKWEKKGMSVDVEVSKERNPKLADHRERVELTIHTSGPVIRSEASADDRYTALDLSLDRIEARLRKTADRHKVHKGSNRAPVSVAAATADLANGTETAPGPVTVPPPAQEQEVAAPDDAGTGEVDEQFDQDELVELDTQGDGPLVVREKIHYAKPMTIDRALMEMELVGHDFYLFHDEERDTPSVVYRRKAFNYGVIRLMD
ncbi:ribosomal subunit interface protein [Lipingzhangella halophila]|uniref:Ribosome hibernation promoting factor n=1 Tax=Lipingzhangella halophila TaxID=1783352 RepID=A0A7W7RKX3_9ACTN|nr:ribosome-associated translation inhibitor RaiA [Lipingzhangella halophila]MBB4933872.1 ribosomal subunit interface protein [Lipingzhangella halophila]